MAQPYPQLPSLVLVRVTGESPTSLLTDYYELTMLGAALGSGAAERTSVFEVFARRLPPGRRYAVACGLGRLVDDLALLKERKAKL